MLTEKDYCDYETCVALKELGYNQYTSLRRYAGKGGVRLWDFDGEPNYKEGELIALSDMYDIPRDGNEVAAPSLYEAQKWLREVKKVIIVIVPYTYNIITETSTWTYEIWLEDNLEREVHDFKTYEEALSEGVRASIKMLKEK